MRENDELTGLFRNRLQGSELPVREGFWEDLSAGLPPASGGAVSGRRLSVPSVRYRRMAVAASAALLLGAASAAWWFCTPPVEDQTPELAQVATTLPHGFLDGDRVQERFPDAGPSIPAEPSLSAGHSIPGSSLPGSHSGHTLPAALHSGHTLPASTDDGREDEEESGFSVRLSVTITQRVSATRQPGRDTDGWWDRQAYTSFDGDAYGQGHSASPVPDMPSRKWALKAGVGTSLPKEDFHMPLTASLTVERRLGRRLSLEAGLQYGYMPVASSAGDNGHEWAIPARLNLLLAEMSDVDVYAQLGGAVGKTVGGGSPDEPVRLSAMAGLGVRYRLNERLALFAEPSVSRHFSSDSGRRTLRSERPLNLNLLCGIRMAY